jgi:Divergent InlB B-repeat domain
VFDETGWTGCSPIDTDPTRCTVVVPGDGTTVEANFRPAALLLVVANGGGGSVTATVQNPQPGEIGQQTCNSVNAGGVVCPYPYLPGRIVTLTPSPLNASVPVWSDDGCLDGAPCTVILDGPRRSITATFATQHVFVHLNGPGHVTSDPAGIDCTAAVDDSFPIECPDNDVVFPTGSDVALIATGANVKWVTDPAPTRAGCDYTDASGTVCHVFTDRTRWAVVSFAGEDPDQQYPPTAGAHFAIRKAGDGSGTVRGGGIDCGSRCSVDTTYGERYVLVADPSGGSRFAGWRRGCGANPRCAVTVGPITRMTAEFARTSTASAAASTPTVKKLQASLRRITVRRSRGRYRIVVPVHLNLAATVTARVTTRRGRRVASHRWKLRAGDRKLTMRVRARRGRYRLALTIRSSDGQVKSFKRTLRFR